MFRRTLPSLVMSLILVLGGVGGAGPASAHQTDHHRGTATETCRDFTRNVTVTSGARYDVVGKVCWRGLPFAFGKTLQVLSPGFTYDATYWDFPYRPETYSYAEDATRKGYAVLTYDRLGTGRSEMPEDTLDLSVESQAKVLHQLVQDARSGHLAGTRFRNVVTVGHSLGAAIGLFEAGRYGDVAATILTSSLRDLNPDFTIDMHPAVEDPKFADSGLSPEIITTVPGERERTFFHQPTAESAAIYVDEGLKTVGVPVEIETINTPYEPSVANGVRVPVLYVMGQRDFLFCNTQAGAPCDTPDDIIERQAPLLPNAKCVEAIVIPETGHDLNLHQSAPETFQAINSWDRCRDSHRNRK